MAVLAIEKVLERIETIVCARRSRVKGAFLVVGIGLQGRGGIAVAVTRRVGWIRAGTLDVGVGRHGRHLDGRDSKYSRLLTSMAGWLTVSLLDTHTVTEVRRANQQAMAGMAAL